MENIGFLLKNARENKNFTQKQVMELTGINRKSLSGYENNVAEPDLSTFSTLLNLYEVSSIVENKTEAISLPLLLQKFNSDIHIYFVMPTTHYLTAYHTFIKIIFSSAQNLDISFENGYNNKKEIYKHYFVI